MEKWCSIIFWFWYRKLKEFYPLNDWRKAFKDIRKYLEERDFIPLKDSDYKNEKINKVGSTILLYEFGIENEWFGKCINKINISPNIEILDISDDVKSYLEEYHKEKEQKKDIEEDFEMEM